MASAAAERLAAAQRQLKQLSWWSRGSRRFELEQEIALRQTALGGFDEKRAELARTPPPRVRQMPGLSRDRYELDRSLRREPPVRQVLRREPPGLEL